MDDRKYLNRKQAAAYLGVCLKTLDVLLAEKRLSYSKVGKRVLIDKADLDRLVLAGRVEAVA